MSTVENHQRAPGWRTLYRAEWAHRQSHKGRSGFWQLVLLGLAAFWATIAYGYYLLG